MSKLKINPYEKHWLGEDAGLKICNENFQYFCDFFSSVATISECETMWNNFVDCQRLKDFISSISFVRYFENEEIITPEDTSIRTLLYICFIEGIVNNEHVGFYDFLKKDLKKNAEELNISSYLDKKNIEYIDKYGSGKKIKKFFINLTNEDKVYLVKNYKFMIKKKLNFVWGTNDENDFDVVKTNEYIEKWAGKIYTMRNDMVHRGHRVAFINSADRCDTTLLDACSIGPYSSTAKIDVLKNIIRRGSKIFLNTLLK